MKKFPKPWYRPITWAVVRDPQRGSAQLGAGQRRGLCSVPATAWSAGAGCRFPGTQWRRSWMRFWTGARNIKPSGLTFRYLDYCQSFVTHLFPELLVSEVKPFHIQEWVDSHATWGNTTKRNAIVAMKRAPSIGPTSKAAFP